MMSALFGGGVSKIADMAMEVAWIMYCRSEPNVDKVGWGGVPTSGVSHHPVAFPLSVLAPSYKLAFGSTSSRTKGEFVRRELGQREGKATG